MAAAAVEAGTALDGNAATEEAEAVAAVFSEGPTRTGAFLVEARALCRCC